MARPEPTAPHLELGRAGEEAAAVFLQKKGMRLVARNWRPEGVSRNLELDMVGEEGGSVVFVEVKTRKNADFAQAREFVTPAKQRRILAAASLYLQEHPTQAQPRFDVFEFIYFARPDSIMEGINVHEIREKSGMKIWEQAPIEADIVIGVPDSGVPAAIGFSIASGIPFRPVLIKNRYIGRSFIVPTQEMRERIVNLKLNPIISEIKGKRVVIIDDSIVRGTTSKRLVKILKDAGVKEIHFRSVSPPIIAPCYLGIDTPTKDDLISANMTVEELRKYLGVDSLEFLSMDNLKNILGSSKHCFGCFTEEYPVPKGEDAELFE